MSEQLQQMQEILQKSLIKIKKLEHLKKILQSLERVYDWQEILHLQKNYGNS